MEPATLYLMLIAATGGPEKRVITHYESEQECVGAMQRWQDESAGGKRYRVSSARCLTADEYNAMIGVFSTDVLDQKLRP